MSNAGHCSGCSRVASNTPDLGWERDRCGEGQEQHAGRTGQGADMQHGELGWDLVPGKRRGSQHQWPRSAYPW